MRSFRRSGRHAFSLTEVLVVIAIVLTLFSVCIPVSQRVMESSKRITCARQMRQIGISALLYASDNQSRLPQTVHQRRNGGVSWSLSLQPYAGDKLVFRCPQDPHLTRPYSYVLNDFLTANPAGAPHLDYSRLDRLTAPHATILFAEAMASYAGTDHFHFSDYFGASFPAAVFRQQVDAERHRGVANYLFADGHVETLSWADVSNRLADSNNPFLDPTRR